LSDVKEDFSSFNSTMSVFE